MYKDVAEVFKDYWTCYGGWSALARSPYLHLAIGLTVAMTPIWTERGWWELPLSVMPNILGFSLGGFAIWLAIGDQRFRELVAGEVDDEVEENRVCSPFMSMNATFVHFIFMQFLSIISGLIAWSCQPNETKIYLYIAPWFVGYLIFIYALLSALAATMAIYRNARMYDTYMTEKHKQPKDTQNQ